MAAEVEAAAEAAEVVEVEAAEAAAVEVEAAEAVVEVEVEHKYDIHHKAYSSHHKDNRS